MRDQPVECGDRFYAVVRQVVRFWIWFFFKAIDARHSERVPPHGPVLLCINHPNNLIDSLLVGAVLSRKVHYLATATLFRNPITARFLAACGAIPVYRRQDDPGRIERNAETFSACLTTLGRGGLIGIYPEGTTHVETRVQRIKTGAARIALEYESGREACSGEPLTVLPVGLTFDARKSFRGRVRVAFGEPILLHSYLAAYHEDPMKAVDTLTREIQWGMEAQVLQVDRPDQVDLIHAVDELYRSELARKLQEERGLSPSQVDPLRLSQTIADAVAHFGASDPERVERLWGQVQRYRAMLAVYHVRDQAVRARLERPRAENRVARSWKASLGLPVFVYAAAVNGLPYVVPRWLARRTARKETDYATTRLLASVVAFPLFWGVEIWIIWRLGGALWALLFAASLPVSGLLGYRYLGGVGRLRSQLRFGWLSVTRHQAASRLLAARQEIIAELEKAKSDYLAAKGGTF
jgi:glycerol-3-phosphate O-acyltransferase / dihydroxyacetone phosphate acyltransferase